MTIPRKALLICFALTLLLAALLIQRPAIAAGMTFGRENLKGTTASQGELSAERPNLADARGLAGQAHDKVIAAQSAGEWDAAGHAKRAEALLSQAIAELKLATDAPSRR